MTRQPTRVTRWRGALLFATCLTVLSQSFSAQAQSTLSTLPSRTLFGLNLTTVEPGERRAPTPPWITSSAGTASGIVELPVVQITAQEQALDHWEDRLRFERMRDALVYVAEQERRERIYTSVGMGIAAVPLVVTGGVMLGSVSTRPLGATLFSSGVLIGLASVLMGVNLSVPERLQNEFAHATFDQGTLARLEQRWAQEIARERVGRRILTGVMFGVAAVSAAAGVTFFVLPTALRSPPAGPSAYPSGALFLGVGALSFATALLVANTNGPMERMWKFRQLNIGTPSVSITPTAYGAHATLDFVF